MQWNKISFSLILSDISAAQNIKQVTALRTCGMSNAFLWTNELILLIQQDPRFIAKITGPNNKKWNRNADHTTFPVYITRNLLQNKPMNLKLKSGPCTSNGPFSHSGERNAVLVYDTETFTRVPRISRQSYQPPPNSRRQNGRTKQALSCRPTVVQWPVNPTVIWRLLLSVCGVIVCYERGYCNNYAENSCRQRSKFSRLGFVLTRSEL